MGVSSTTLSALPPTTFIQDSTDEDVQRIGEFMHSHHSLVHRYYVEGDDLSEEEIDELESGEAMMDALAGNTETFVIGHRYDASSRPDDDIHSVQMHYANYEGKRYLVGAIYGTHRDGDDPPHNSRPGHVIVGTESDYSKIADWVNSRSTREDAYGMLEQSGGVDARPNEPQSERSILQQQASDFLQLDRSKKNYDNDYLDVFEPTKTFTVRATRPHRVGGQGVKVGDLVTYRLSESGKHKLWWVKSSI